MIGVISASTRPGRLSHNVAKLLVDKLEERETKGRLIDLMEGNPPNYSHPISELEDGSAIKTLGDSIDTCKGMIWVSPEYNGGYTGGLKNIVDMCPKSFFSNKPIGISSISVGGLAGMRGALQMQHLALATFGIPSPSMLLVPTVQTKFDDKGTLIDPDFGGKVDAFLDAYMWLYERLT